MSRSALRVSAGEGAVVLQAADEALRAAGPLLTKITRTLLLSEEAEAWSRDDGNDEATSSESAIMLNAFASMFSIAFHGPLSTVRAIVAPLPVCSCLSAASLHTPPSLPLL